MCQQIELDNWGVNTGPAKSRIACLKIGVGGMDEKIDALKEKVKTFRSVLAAGI